MPDPNLSPADQVKYWVKRIIHLLSLRDRSTAEISSFLEKNKVDPELIDQINQKISQFNLLNDDGFAQSYLNSLINKHKGPRFIKSKLAQKGIPESTSETLIKAIPQSRWRQAAKEIIAKKKIPKRFKSTYHHQQYLKQYLYTQGFQANLIQNIFDEEGL
jgi:regulatory protein